MCSSDLICEYHLKKNVGNKMQSDLTDLVENALTQVDIQTDRQKNSNNIGSTAPLVSLVSGCQSIVQEAQPVRLPGQTNTQGVEIIEERVLPLP